MFKASNEELLGNLQILFSVRKRNYEVREDLRKKVCVPKGKVCISVCGTDLWNELNVELKQIKHIKQLKKR